jgi:D-alanyl-D-alanine carboxypeptidase
MNGFSVSRAGAAALAICLVATAPNGASVAAVDGPVQSAMQGAHVPGAELAIVRDGRLVIDRGYGVANVDTQMPVTASTHFEVGSITKQFTAAAILQLEERGKLRLSDPLGKYVPEYARGRNVTIEQLLWQISGIPNYTSANHFVHIAGTTPGGVDAALALIENKPLHFKPGTQWRYSNTNYLLLGAVVARVSHMSWESYLRKNVFAPAGMTHTAFILNEASLPDMATGYHRDKKGVVRPSPRLVDAWAGAAGSIVSTASDMAKWDEAFFSGRIVDARDVRLATAAHRLPSGRSTGYGFGWVVDTFDGQPRIWHSGGTFGFTSQNEYFPKLHEFVIALVNTSSVEASGIGAAAFEAMHPAIAAAVQRPAAGEDPNVTALAREWLHRAQTGEIDRAQLTATFAASLTPQIVAQTEAALGPLGTPLQFVYRGKKVDRGVTVYRYRIGFTSAKLVLVIGIDQKGKIAEIGFMPI